MYQYAKEKLKNDLKEQQTLKNQNVQALKEVGEKIDWIASYDKLEDDQAINIVVAVICILIGGPLLGVSVTFLIKMLIAASTIGIKFFFTVIALIDALLLYIGKYYINQAKSTAKEMKSLKQKGVKEFENQKSELLDKQSELEKEGTIIQNKMDKITNILNSIAFFKKTISEPFYQADTKEEYESLKREQSLDNNLNEKMDYSDSYLDFFSSDMVIPDGCARKRENDN